MYYYINMKTKKFKVTAREFDIIKLIYKGMTNNEIANQLDISVHTVKTHLEKLYEKFNVHTRTELAIQAFITLK